MAAFSNIYIYHVSKTQRLLNSFCYLFSQKCTEKWNSLLLRFIIWSSSQIFSSKLSYQGTLKNLVLTWLKYIKLYLQFKNL